MSCPLSHISVASLDHLARRLSALAKNLRSMATSRDLNCPEICLGIDESEVLYAALEAGDLLRELAGMPADLTAGSSNDSLLVLNISTEKEETRC